MMMMKPDDRDIICEQDYTPLSNAELVAHIETYARLMHSTPLSGAKWLDDIIGPARVLLNRNSAQAARMRTAAARVADLESQLAAQQWRPVTAEWPLYGERVIIGYGGGYGGGWSAFARRVRTDDRDAWLMDDDTTMAFESAAVAMQRPLPPAPQEATE